MTATTARIGLVTSEYRLGIAGPDAGVVAAYGNLARDVDPKEPIPTFFVSAADADEMAERRLALLKHTRRRFVMDITDAFDVVLAMAASATAPCVRVISSKYEEDKDALVVKARINLSNGSATVETWG